MKTTDLSREIEEKIKKIINRQVEYGIYFDLKTAQELAKELNVNLILQKDRLKKIGITDPDSKEQAIKQLLAAEWKPKILNRAGEPVLNKTVYRIDEDPRLKELERYYKERKLLELLKTNESSFIKKCYPDSRIYPKIDPDGANTHRMVTSEPNITQLPRNMRNLLIAPQGKELISIDAKSLELTMLGFYLIPFDQGKYADLVDKTDIHEVYRKKLALDSRDDSKIIIYGILYGRNPTAIGIDIYKGQQFSHEQLKLDYKKFKNKEYISLDKKFYIEVSDQILKAAQFGKHVIDKFYEETPGLKDLKEAIYSKKALRAIDGRELNVRSPYLALNTLLQSAGAISMKFIQIGLEEKFSQIFQYARDYAFTGNFHDEILIEIDPRLKHDIEKITEETFIQRSKLLMSKALRGKFNNSIRPIKGKFK